MTVGQGRDGEVALVGICDSGDAEILLARLLANPKSSVDWSACEAAHTAVVQVLLAAGIAPTGAPKSRDLVEILEPLLKRR